MEEFWNLFVFICYVIRKKPEKPILMVFFIFLFICVNEIEIIHKYFYKNTSNCGIPRII